jgi:hypothetical protein
MNSQGAARHAEPSGFAAKSRRGGLCHLGLLAAAGGWLAAAAHPLNAALPQQRASDRLKLAVIRGAERGEFKFHRSSLRSSELISSHA